jgi:hypothetical protein
VREQAWTFGSEGGLVGIYSEPQGGANPCRPAALLFNVGLNHHVGPNRLNVDLARRLAALGFASLRFDLSGLGDSEARRDLRSDEERAVLDLTEAMEELTRRKEIGSFVLISLCSGVDPAHAVAAADSHVTGAIFMDGYAYETAGYRLRAALERALRLLDRESYTRALMRRLRRFGKARPEIGERVAIFDRTFPPKATFKADLARMLSHAELLFLYTRHGYFFNHVSQFARMIGERQLPHGVEVKHLLAADHVFTAVSARKEVIDLICRWVSRVGSQATPVPSVHVAS